MSYNIKPGDKYNKLTAMYFVYKNNRGDNIWHFKCDCGKEKDMVGYLVASGARKSCGCARKDCKHTDALKQDYIVYG